MKEFLYGWIRDVAFYTLLMNVVLHVLPEESQRKYLRFFMGIVLMIVVLSPVLSAMGLNRVLDDTYVEMTSDQELQDFKRRQEEAEKALEQKMEELETESESESESEIEMEEEEKLGIPEIKVEMGEPEEAEKAE